MSIFKVVGAAVAILSGYFMLTHAFSTLTDYELSNGAFLLYQLERAWDKYLGDCAGYAYYWALDDAGGNVSAVRRTDITNHFDTCISEALSKMRAFFDVDVDTTYVWRGSGGSWQVEGSVSLQLRYVNTRFQGAFPFKKDVNASGTPVTITVVNTYTKELEANGTYP